MLKKLLYLCIGALPLCTYAQTNPSAEGLIDTEMVVEDPNKIVTNLTSLVVDKSKVSLAWSVNDSLPDFFIIERSENGRQFEVVTVLNNLQKKPDYQWVDDSPKKGRSFYRIKYAFDQGPYLYSSTVNAAISGYIDYKFYPNPVDHILIVRCETPIDVQIMDGNGKVRITETRIRGVHTINVTSLEKGVYIIRFSNKLTNVISQDKLIKN